MAYTTSLTIAGLSRADGTTARTVTFKRVANVKDGYILRESGVPANLAATCTFRTHEEKGAKGLLIRVIQETWSWPYENPAVPGIVAGYVNHGPTGLRFPVDAPPFVLADVRYQLANRASSSAGTVGFAHIYSPMITGEYPA